MTKPAIKINFKGVQEALARAKDARTQLAQEIGREVTSASMRVVNEAKGGSPVKDGLLRNSIDILESKPFVRVVGSPLEYAARQEYEHKSKRGFFRKALFNERNRFREALSRVIARVGGRY